MKKIIIILLFATLSCNKHNLENKHNVEIEPGFTKIGKSFNDRDKLIVKIEPNRKYQYWEYVFSQPYFKTNQDRIIYQSGDPSLKLKYKFINPKKGFFNECHPALCYSYIAYVENGKVNYITDENQLKNFIGNITTLEEAILIGKINDLWFDSEKIEGGAYKKIKNGYELYLMKYDNCPIKMESIKVHIDSTGKFTSKKNGIYYESDDCIMS